MDYVVPSRFDPQVSSHSIFTIDSDLTASDVRRVLHTDISKYVNLARDRNPIHSNPDYAQGTRFGQEIALGLLPEGILSSLLGTKLPGQGAIYVGKTVSFLAPVNAGDRLTTIIQVEEVDRKRRIIQLSGECHNQNQISIAEYKTTLMLDKGQELEFVCDFFKFASERDPLDLHIFKDWTHVSNSDLKENFSQRAKFYNWPSKIKLIKEMMDGLEKHKQSDAIQNLLFSGADTGSPAQSLDQLVWWTSAPHIFLSLRDSLDLSPTKAVAAILDWTCQSQKGESKVNLPGLQKLSEVDLSNRIMAFDPQSQEEVTRDMVAAIGRYVANFVIARKK